MRLPKIKPGDRVRICDAETTLQRLINRNVPVNDNDVYGISLDVWEQVKGMECTVVNVLAGVAATLKFPPDSFPQGETDPLFMISGFGWPLDGLDPVEEG